MDPKLTDELIEKAVGKHIQNDMVMVTKAFDTVIQKYAFLFNGDIIATQQMLIAACFPTTVPVVDMAEEESEEDKVHFNMNQIIGSIPQDMKSELYGRIMAQFVTKVKIDDINGKKGDAE